MRGVHPRVRAAAAAPPHPNFTAMSSIAFARVFARVAPIASLVVTLSACAGSTVGSGVGDRMLEEPPYYAGRLLPITERSFAVTPIGYQRGAAQSPIFEPEGDDGGELAALLRDMNAFLADSLRVGVTITDARALPGRAVDVMFRCETDTFDDCAFPEDGAGPQMRLAVARPSQEWADALATSLDRAGATYALVITLEISDYWTYQRNFRGSKEVRLGTDNRVDVPWLTSLETPVSVLQLTGAVIDREGRAVRIGAEGLLARRTSIVVSAIGGQQLISDEDIATLRTQRRDDRAGAPLAWQVALRALVEGLIGEP
jgi:hypothetical protein